MSLEFEHMVPWQSQQGGKPERPRIAPDIEAELLRAAYREYNTVDDFETGMVVRQKQSCRIYRITSANGFAVVMELLDDPVENERVFEGADDNYADMVIGYHDQDGDFMTKYVDSHRFERVPENALK